MPSVSQATLDRFLAKVQKSPDPDGCWLWTAGRFKKGYGGFYVDGQMVRAHRFAYEQFVGPVPDGLMVLHTCDVYTCVRPTHLYAGTREQNTADAVERGRFASGDRNGARTRPERNAVRLYPERVARGERANKSHLTDADVRAIRDLHAGGMTQTDLARRYGIHQGTVWKIVRRKIWCHLA